MKLLIDEMYPRVIARELRARGHDATSVHEAPGRGTLDEEVFDHARSEGRAVVTENVRDYRPLAEALLAAGDGHAGLVFTTDKALAARRSRRSHHRVRQAAFHDVGTAAERRNLALIVGAALSGCGQLRRT